MDKMRLQEIGIFRARMKDEAESLSKDEFDSFMMRCYIDDMADEDIVQAIHNNMSPMETLKAQLY